MNKKRVTLGGQELFSRRFNTAADLNGKAHTVKITALEPVTVFVRGKAQEKIAIHFEKAQRPFLMGVELAESIAQALSDELHPHEYKAENWIGQTITIYPSPTPLGDQVLARKTK